ncbi:MAG: ankyrin repeat domain-containing protein [Brevinema sp.]
MMYTLAFLLLSCVSLSFGQNISPVFEAVAQDDLSLIDPLMRKRAAVNITNSDGMSPLHFASSAEMANVLLINGADPNIQNKEGATPLHWAITQNNDNLVRILFQFGANANLADKKGNTPLHYASQRGDSVNMLLLLQGGANPNARNNEGDTPLIMSLASKRLDSSYYLIMAGAQDIPNRAGERPGRMLSPITSPDILTALINPPTPPLIRAIFLEQVPQAIELINNSTAQEINQQDVAGNTALHWAFIKKNREISRLLLNKGANRGIANNNGQTAMSLLNIIPDPSFVDFIDGF